MESASADWGDKPSILIFGDHSEDRASAAMAAASLHARVVGEGPIEEALDRLDRQVAVDAIMIELTGDGGAEQDRVLDRLERAARDGLRVVVSMPLSLIDAVYARIEAPGVSLLCDPGVPERAAALSLALAGRGRGVREDSVEAEAERLLRLSEDVARIANALADLSGSVRSVSLAPLHAHPATFGTTQINASAVRNLIRIRRLREQFFPRDLFADPAWDMLLDLLAARLERSRVAVSSLCIAAAVPATTALRWIRALTEQGLFVRRQDPDDGRRIFIDLSDPAADALTAYFNSARQMGLSID